jgi:ubiquitin-protein ligase
MTSISSFATRVLPAELSDAFAAVGERTPWLSRLVEQAKPLAKSLPSDGSVTFACEKKLRSTTPREMNMYFKPTSGSYAGSVLEFNIRFPISFPGSPVFVTIKQLVYHPRCTPVGSMSLKTGGTMEAACGELLQIFSAVAPDEDEKLVANRGSFPSLFPSFAMTPQHCHTM